MNNKFIHNHHQHKMSTARRQQTSHLFSNAIFILRTVAFHRIPASHEAVPLRPPCPDKRQTCSIPRRVCKQPSHQHFSFRPRWTPTCHATNSKSAPFHATPHPVVFRSKLAGSRPNWTRYLWCTLTRSSVSENFSFRHVIRDVVFFFCTEAACC